MREVDVTNLVRGSEVSLEDLDARALELLDAEQVALRALGEAELRGLSGGAARAELRRVRDSLTATHAAARVLEASGGLR